MKPQYGNSAGRNKGKKYVKLTGDEIATPEAEQRAQKFVCWYGASYKYLARSIRDYNEEVASDTMLQICDDILYKERHIRNYRTYFLRAYHTEKLKQAIYEKRMRDTHFSLDAPCEDEQDSGDKVGIIQKSRLFAGLPAPEDSEHAEKEIVINALYMEMLEYVRKNYAPMEVSVFEIYVGLLPDISYSKLSAYLGISANRIYLIISEMKRDLKENYQHRRYGLLSFS